MNNKKLFPTILIVNGVLIVIGLAFSVIARYIQIDFAWYGAIWIFAFLVILVDVFSLFRSRLCGHLINKQVKGDKNEFPPAYRIEEYVIHRRKKRDPIEDEFPPLKLVNTPGRRSLYTDKRKREATEKWDRIKQQSNGVVLEEFLESEFGSKNGVLNVSKSTFYKWRRKLKERADDKQNR